jgi:hypothetical protein
MRLLQKAYLFLPRDTVNGHHILWSAQAASGRRRAAKQPDPSPGLMRTQEKPWADRP